MTRITALLLILSISSISSIKSFSSELKETRMLSHFNEIVATNGINVLLRQSSENKAEIKIENALLSDVITEVKGNTLKLKIRPQINKELSVLVIIYYKQLNSLSVSKGASIQTKSVLLSEDLKMKASTGSSIKAEVECINLKISSIGGSKIKLYGWSERLDIKGAAKSKTDTKELKTDRVFCRSTSGAECWVNPKDYLEAIANTGGTIYYTKKPSKLIKKLSSGGELINKSKENQIGYDLIRDEK